MDDSRRTIALLGLNALALGGLAPRLLTLIGNADARTPAVPAGSRAQIARHLPNVEFRTQHGRRVRFYDDLVKDKKVIINFMYARCDGICVPVTMNLNRVHKRLGDRVGRDIFMYSITLKPAEDSPENLRLYREHHGVDGSWLFLTGAPHDIDHLRRALGFAIGDPAEDADISNHIGMIRYGVEPRMRWAACPGTANPEHIVQSILWDLA
jgi:protein SCO1